MTIHFNYYVISLIECYMQSDVVEVVATRHLTLQQGCSLLFVQRCLHMFSLYVHCVFFLYDCKEQDYVKQWETFMTDNSNSIKVTAVCPHKCIN